MASEDFYEKLAQRIFCAVAVIDLKKKNVTYKYVRGDESLCGKTTDLAELKGFLSRRASFDTNSVSGMTYDDLRAVYAGTYRKKSFLLSCEVKRNVLKKYVVSFYPVSGDKKLYVTAAEAESSESVLNFVSKKTEISIDMNKILYVGYGNHCVEFYCSDGCCNKLFNVAFGDVADVLLHHKNFVRSYKNCIVNMDKVKSVLKDCFIMSDGSNIPIPKRRCRDILHTYGEYTVLKANTLDLE